MDNKVSSKDVIPESMFSIGVNQFRVKLPQLCFHGDGVCGVIAVDAYIVAFVDYNEVLAAVEDINVV